MLLPNIWVTKIAKNEMGGACGTYGGQEKGIQGLDAETRGKETTRKIKEQMGG
jgi:hypothetical protein